MKDGPETQVFIGAGVYPTPDRMRDRQSNAPEIGAFGSLARENVRAKNGVQINQRAQSQVISIFFPLPRTSIK